MVLAVVAPGQGAQAPGFLTPWLSRPRFAGRIRAASAATRLDLVALGTDPAALGRTEVVQPLLVASAVAAADELFGDEPAAQAAQVGVVAGHSLGELTAATLAGVVTVPDGLALARARGRAMAAACDGGHGMSAILGDVDGVGDVLTALGLQVANRNAAGQVVVAGPRAALDRLAAEPPAGVRVRPLAVAGAFHTDAMTSARDAFARAVADVTPADAGPLFLSNRDGAALRDGADILARLVAQITAPVRWDACMQTMADLGVTAVIELPPAGTLTGLLRRALPDVQTVALRTPEDLAAAHRLLDRPADPEPGPVGETPSWRLVVAPRSGRFQPADRPAGDRLRVDDLLGRVVGSRDTVSVTAPTEGVLLEWLALAGDPVRPGQPLARLQPGPK